LFFISCFGAAIHANKDVCKWASAASGTNSRTLLAFKEGEKGGKKRDGKITERRVAGGRGR